jgi:hypothetical protein
MSKTKSQAIDLSPEVVEFLDGVRAALLAVAAMQTRMLESKECDLDETGPLGTLAQVSFALMKQQEKALGVPEVLAGFRKTIVS